MTAVDVLGRVDELTEGTNSSRDAVMGAAIDPYRESRLSTVASGVDPNETVGTMTRFIIIRAGAPVTAVGRGLDTRCRPGRGEPARRGAGGATRKRRRRAEAIIRGEEIPSPDGG